VTTPSTQLRVLADVSRSLATFNDLDELVHFATRRTRELFDAEGCAILLLDDQRREFCFPVASQREAGTVSAAELAEIRFPADRGIAGWVLTHDEGALVSDTAADERFYSEIDRRTAVHTRALLCAPLRTRGGNIGVIEVVNPGPGRLQQSDLEFLDILASEIGVGFLIALATAFYHRARVLPWSELPATRGALGALACLIIGGLLVGVGKGWIVSMRAGRRVGA
jgi:GAF domain-containing protein